MKKALGIFSMSALILGGFFLFQLHRAAQAEGESEGQNNQAVSSESENGLQNQASTSMSGQEDEQQFSNLLGKLGEDANNTFDSISGSSDVNLPESMSVGPDGKTQITGAQITAINGNVLTVSVWGLSVPVDISSAQVAGINTLAVSNASGTTPTSFAVGDKVLARGTITSGTLKADWIKDLTQQSSQVSAIQAKINDLLKTLQQLEQQLRLQQGGGQ